MKKHKVYISDFDYPDNDVEKAILEPVGAEVIGLQCRSGKGLAELAPDAEIILQQYAKIDRRTIEGLPNLRAICRYGIGLDIIDLKAAKENDVVITNVPDYCLDEVADHSITMGFMLIRRIPQYVDATRKGQWHWNACGGPIKRYRGLVWGLIGFGQIAQNITRKLQAFGISVISSDPYVSHGYMRSHGVEKVEFRELMERVDVINVICPHNPETDRMINDETLGWVKPGAVLINSSRGKVIDNAALERALNDNRISVAGLDDTDDEPAKHEKWSLGQNPLFEHPSCFVTPHVAYVSENSLIECRQVAAENARAVILGETPPNLIA
ncbi:MAG: C-terminal binding protein [Rhodospirillales bacterium]|nr:C-terminal binding protein [Rhodospirillales bacterium]